MREFLKQYFAVLGAVLGVMGSLGLAAIPIILAVEWGIGWIALGFFLVWPAIIAVYYSFDEDDE